MKKNKLRHIEHIEKDHFNAKMLSGIFVIAFGVLILLRQLAFPIPHFLVSWEMILILIGIVTLVRHRYKKMGGYILIGIGCVFMINDFYPQAIEIRFVWPILLIIFGVSIFIKASRSRHISLKTEGTSIPTDTQNMDDYFDSVAFFGGVNKNVVSKNFKGARISSIFGGTELNLTNADIHQQAIVDVSCVFGGINVIVPSNWKVQSDITSIFGGIDDKRHIGLIDENSEKLLILKGSCVFGGVEIISYV